MYQEAAIYIPVPGSPLDAFVAPGSGIVGRPRDESVVIFYEGNLSDAVNMHTWQSRLRCAAGRMFTRYPTCAILAIFKNDSTWTYRFQDLVQVGKIVQLAADDHFYQTTIALSTIEALRAYTGEADLDLLSAPRSHHASLRLFELAGTLDKLQARLDEVRPKNGLACAPEESAVWDAAITEINAQLVVALPEIAATTGNSLTTLNEWFQPRSPHETWFGPQSNNRPAAYLANVARFQSMNPDRWA